MLSPQPQATEHPMATTLEKLTSDRETLLRSIALREDLLAELSAKRDALLRKVAAGRDVELDDEVLELSARIAGLSSLLDTLRQRHEEAAAALADARHRAVRSQTAQARKRIATRAAKQVALARSVDEAGAALLQAMSAYREAAEALANDAVPVLQSAGLLGAGQVPVVLGLLRAGPATEAAVLLVREIVRQAPGAGLDNLVITSNGVPDGGPGFERAAIKAAESVQSRLVDMLRTEDEAADA